MLCIVYSIIGFIDVFICDRVWVYKWGMVRYNDWRLVDEIVERG